MLELFAVLDPHRDLSRDQPEESVDCTSRSTATAPPTTHLTNHALSIIVDGAHLLPVLLALDLYLLPVMLPFQLDVDLYGRGKVEEGGHRR